MDEAEALFVQCRKAPSETEDLDISLDNLVATAIETVGILELSAESFDAHCRYAPFWKRIWYTKQKSIHLLWGYRIDGLRTKYLDCETGEFLTLDPSKWKTINEYVDDNEARTLQIKKWDEQERSMFTRRWLRVHPLK